MAFIPSAISQAAAFAGGFFYNTSASIACNSSGSFGRINLSGTFTAASGSISIPTGEWVRFAWKHQGISNTFYGESQMFKGANLLGSVPDASFASDVSATDGLAYIGPTNGWNQSLFIDSVIISDEGWPTRGSAPSFSPNRAGQHNF
jgi:hypothetical protein